MTRVSPGRETVVLFDLDGTLLTTAGAGRRALAAAFLDLYGWADACEGVEMPGRTDPAIIRSVLRERGAPADELDAWRPVADRYVARLPEELARPPAGRLLPGVAPLLDALAGVAGVHVGLLTGNVEEGARLKLARYGIADRFAFGAYGSDDEIRPRLLPVALVRAAAAAGRGLADARVVVIGDTPYDVEVGRIHRAATIAAATGRYDRDALAAAGADLVLDDLSDLARILDFLASVRPAGLAP